MKRYALTNDSFKIAPGHRSRTLAANNPTDRAAHARSSFNRPRSSQAQSSIVKISAKATSNAQKATAAATTAAYQ